MEQTIISSCCGWRWCTEMYYSFTKFPKRLTMSAAGLEKKKAVFDYLLKGWEELFGVPV